MFYDYHHAGAREARMSESSRAAPRVALLFYFIFYFIFFLPFLQSVGGESGRKRGTRVDWRCLVGGVLRKEGWKGRVWVCDMVSHRTR